MSSYTGVVEDVISPKNFILPIVSGAVAVPCGFTCISGGKINFYNGAAWEVVTSA